MLLIFWEVKISSPTEKAIKNTLEKVYAGIVTSREITTKNYHKYVVKVIFTDSKNIKKLNKTYRGLDKETDVLSFAELDTSKRFLQEEKSLGEIYINYDWIKKDVRRKTSDFRVVSELFIHGYLHLLGYDHEKDDGKMEKLEKNLRNKFCLV